MSYRGEHYERYTYEKLISAMLVDDTHRRLYTRSPSFRAGVETVAHTIVPALLDGLAVQAERQDRRVRELQQEMMVKGQKIVVTDEHLREMGIDPEVARRAFDRGSGG